MRILLSEKTAAELREPVEQIFAGKSFEICHPREVCHSRVGGNPDHPKLDFDLAFVSRDVTGKSTKHVLEPATQAFHDALRNAPSLKWVQIHSAGTDRPIYPELLSRGVIVTTASGTHAAIVAQTALGGILALARRFPQLMEQQRNRQWKSLVVAPPPDLAGTTAVILGWGPIAQLLAGWLSAMGVRIEVIRNTNELAGGHPTWTFDQIEQVAPRANWLVIACPLSGRTRDLVGKGVFDRMPEGSHLINIGRGEIVVEDDLIQVLTDGKLAGAYLDVFQNEPLPEASPLWSLPNVIVTPHSAGHSAGNEKRVAAVFLENLARFVAVKPLKNRAG